MREQLQQVGGIRVEVSGLSFDPRASETTMNAPIDRAGSPIQTRELPPPLLKGEHISLVPPDKEYWETIRSWESDPNEMHLWTHRQGIPTREEFEESFAYRLRHYFLAYFVILDRDDKPCGFVYGYESRGESFFFTCYVDERHRASGMAVRAIARFLHWCFAFHSFERVLADTFSYNPVSERNLEKAGFLQTGEIVRHRRFLGQFHTLHQWELTRQAFYERHLPLLRRELE